ncbi:hypothetical protein ACOT81_13405 [Streptomyces sp. WI04-05B]|uniref:hypothetical protein n=1 Tax=Streptomyces TaxID=1883 RepID=UPI0029B60AD2|nr:MULTISPECIES: hypothetical protein [unclassified Streptomyces]MDX2540622.1 hypothetical protein [Streptomyces sp. WI04-05B]MDX2584946.1 hypothetical protein [Streptomyces sp. WI04-05A]MDX3749214.1 hypothetical protein [Streptomyces sp. AK08-02]
MNDASTMQPLSADAHEASGHSYGQGRHRGPVSAHNDETTPHGRHRKPSEQAENRA